MSKRLFKNVEQGFNESWQSTSSSCPQWNDPLRKQNNHDLSVSVSPKPTEGLILRPPWLGGEWSIQCFSVRQQSALLQDSGKKAQFLLLVCKAVKGTQYMDSHLLLCKAWLMRFIFHNHFLSHCLIESKLQCHQRRHPNLSYRENLINHNVKDDVDNVSNHECSACYKTWDLFFPTCHTYLHNKAIIVFF